MTKASASVRDVHRRMPVILKPEAFMDWMDESTSDGALKEIISNHTHKDLVFRPVSKAVNSVQNNSADLIEER